MWEMIDDYSGLEVLSLNRQVVEARLRELFKFPGNKREKGTGCSDAKHCKRLGPPADLPKPFPRRLWSFTLLRRVTATLTNTIKYGDALNHEPMTPFSAPFPASHSTPFFDLYLYWIPSEVKNADRHRRRRKLDQCPQVGRPSG
ncbi:hypothetical protein NMY22_g17069 [Coprinellus aureogranulatus]|nr:hypothetical protein NMY22_g17069 [Coprinellus aureogranulatus]